MPPHSVLACYADDTFGACLWHGMGHNRPSGGAGGGLYGRRDQGIRAEGVPWEVRGNMVLPQGRSRDASSGLSREVGRSWDRGRNQHEVSGPDSLQSLDLRRSLRTPGTVCRGDGEHLRTFAVSAERARRRSYGTPTWAEDLMDNRRSLLVIRRLHRTVAIRIVSGFRTISAAAAAVLAGFPLFEFQALRWREIYLAVLGVCRAGLVRWTPTFEFGLGEPCSTDGAPASTWERAPRG